MLLLVLVLLFASAVSSASPLLLIVGDVTATTARVLLDGDVSSSVQLYEQTAGSSSSPTFTVAQEIALDAPTAPSRPRVVVLDGLTPGRDYVLSFSSSDDQSVRFRTLSDSPSRVLVVSCDRFVDDHDDALWVAMESDIDKHKESYVGVAHIGDQVYVDAGDARIPIEPVTDAIAADPQQLATRFETIVTQFRAIYRATFGRKSAQRILRRGAHWMLPDDHEILNNLNSYFVDRIFSQRPTPELRGLELHYRAGLQVLYEFQVQLRRDVSWDGLDFLTDPLEKILSQYPLYFSVELPRLQLFFLDVRFDRSFALRSHNERSRLISPTQFSELQRQLTKWNSTDGASAVVLSNLPLFFHTPLTANIAYAVEKELYPGHPEHFDGLTQLYALLQDIVPTLKLVVGGDVHTLAHLRICASSGCFDELITSGLTSGSTAMQDAKLVPFYFLILQLTPLVEWCMKVIGWTSTPWVRSVDRVFLGRNYGVLEIDANGAFEWRNSVVLEHETTGAIATQWVFDVLEPATMVMLSFVAVLYWFRSQRSHKRQTKRKNE